MAYPLNSVRPILFGSFLVYDNLALFKYWTHFFVFNYAILLHFVNYVPSSDLLNLDGDTFLKNNKSWYMLPKIFLLLFLILVLFFTT